jgi:hypothetical protein
VNEINAARAATIALHIQQTSASTVTATVMAFGFIEVNRSSYSLVQND